MNHLNESELIAHFCGESEHAAACERHLESCSACAAAYKMLMQDLTLIARDVDQEPLPERGAHYGDEVWQRLKPALEPDESLRRSWFRWLRPAASDRTATPRVKLAWALAAVVLVLGTFLAGRFWEHVIAPHPLVAQLDPAPAPKTVQPVIVVLLSDHLERSERLLVELNHPDEAVVDSALQATARQLLAENRHYRQAVTGANNPANAKSDGTDSRFEISPAMTLTLDDLDRVFAQVAGQKGGLSRTEIAQVKQQINTSGVLFQVRVLRSRVTHTSTSTTAARGDGTV
jgi:anti-sigma factor RsiW